MMCKKADKTTSSTTNEPEEALAISDQLQDALCNCGTVVLRLLLW